MAMKERDEAAKKCNAASQLMEWADTAVTAARAELKAVEEAQEQQFVQLELLRWVVADASARCCIALAARQTLTDKQAWLCRSGGQAASVAV